MKKQLLKKDDKGKILKKYEHVIYNMGYGNEDNRHPEEVFGSFGIRYDSCQPSMMQECWHLIGVTGLPDPLPPNFTIVDLMAYSKENNND